MERTMTADELAELAVTLKAKKQRGVLSDPVGTGNRDPEQGQDDDPQDNIPAY